MRPIMINGIQDLPTPILTRTMTLDSDYIYESNFGFSNIFKLPKLGDYLYSFKLISDNYLWNNNLDNVLLYIDSISLCVNSPNNVLSEIKVRTKPFPGSIYQSLTYDLNFVLGDFPIISGAMNNQELLIVINFNEKPHQKYLLEYQIGFLDEQSKQEIDTLSIFVKNYLCLGDNYHLGHLNYHGQYLSIS